ncbi:MDR family oxidoreductase [Salibaculum halophilum]|uniref:MDR family oxidoreductase n=1 Tax=Salibaculum halophilum TaxID=1914408 RepID=UPI000A103383|nr:MDR family oxidoreductase [Salibaculum halophilum]
MFNALIIRKDAESGTTTAAVEEIADTDLPAGEVTVSVEYSTLNYKDGLCIGPGGGLVRNYPHVPGIDFAGTVEASSDDRYAPGDKVVLTGWRVGEAHWGGHAQKARVKADWLVPLPEGLDTRQAMAVGTAGLTAMLAVMALEAQGIKEGPILVTGAAGGVGSIATALLARLGHEVAAVTGRPEQAEYLTGLGATEIIARDDLAEATRKPLEGERWGGAVDAVAGAMLGRVLKQMRYGASVAAIGLAGGAEIEGALITPFILRGVNLLGIDSVMQPFEARQRAWERIARDLPMDRLEEMVQPATLADLPQLGADILAGRVKGRVVVDVNA